MKIEEIGEINTVDGITETFFVHAEGKDARRVEADADAAVEEILRLAGVIITPDHHVFLGECVDSLTLIEIEDGDDRHEPVPHHDSPHHHGHHGGHIHCHVCGRIKVTVTYNGNEKHHRFSPATTIETVLTWTAKKFNITAVDAEKLVLKLSDGDKPLKPDAHLGDLVHGHTQCSITMELVPDHGRVNG